MIAGRKGVRVAIPIDVECDDMVECVFMRIGISVALIRCYHSTFSKILVQKSSINILHQDIARREGTDVLKRRRVLTSSRWS